MIIVNGKEMDFADGITIEEMLSTLNLKKDRVVVELNMEILPPEEFPVKTLMNGDRVEIVSFVGGG